MYCFNIRVSRNYQLVDNPENEELLSVETFGTSSTSETLVVWGSDLRARDRCCDAPISA